jgi:phosphatidylinositol kinase/protein kinase (PI-3  family)
METITDAVSVHSIKKEAYARLAAADAAQAGYLPSFTLYDHFLAAYGQPDTPRFRKAQDAFMKSLASYSIITYLLQIKDRHNGNILLDKEGHVMHIDFGFMLSNSPGSLGFEMAPFKLTQDYIDILGGFESPKFVEYKTHMKRLFKDVRRHAERIIMLVELMQVDSRLPCFSNGTATVQQLRDRFQLTLSTSSLDEHIERLVVSSAGSAFTRLYDTFQRHSQGVL